MQVRQYLKNVIGAVLPPVAKSLWGVSPVWSTGISMINQRVFTWDIGGYQAYNNKIFYTGANLIVRKMTEAPLTFNRKRTTAKKSLEKFYSKTATNPERSTIKADALEELPESHEILNLIDYETMEDFWHRWNFGAGVLYFEKLDASLSRNTKPTKVWSLDPKRMTAITNDGKMDNIAYYNYTCLNGEQLTIEKDDILYFRHWNPNKQSLMNYGVDIPAGIDIALNNAGNEAEGAAYRNGGRGTLFSSKVDHVGDEGVRRTKFTAEQMASLQNTANNDMAGARNNRAMLFTNGEVIVTPYGDTLAEMEISKSEDTRWKNIFAIMGIPKELSPATFSSSENSVDAGYKALVTNLIVPTLKRFDKALTKKIQQWWSDVVALSDLTEYTELAPDLKLYKEVYGSPYASVDTINKIFGLDEVGGDIGKAILVNSGLMPIQDVINPMEEPGQSDVL